MDRDMGMDMERLGRVQMTLEVDMWSATCLNLVLPLESKPTPQWGKL